MSRRGRAKAVGSVVRAGVEALSVGCSRCQAEPGSPCRRGPTQWSAFSPVANPHAARLKAARSGK